MNALVQALGWTLLHFLWQGLLIGCATALAWAVLRNARPEARYAVGCGALLACLAWVVFSVLLWGRNRLGWRGHKAIRWTLGGFCLLMLAYFGSKLVREFILHI